MIRPKLSLALFTAIVCLVWQAQAQLVMEANKDVHNLPLNIVQRKVVSPSTPSAPTHDQNQEECSLDPLLVEEIRGYQSTVDTIIDYTTRGDYKGKTYDILAELVDTFGPRMSGSHQLEATVDWMLERSNAEGLDNVHTEDAAVPYWVRNNESAWMVLPRLHQLHMLGLGSSVGTPPEDIRAEILVVKSFDELSKNADQAAGKIVVYNPEWVSYGETVQYRSYGATRAAEVGAVASLIRSVGPFSIDSPHTGHQVYGDAPKIPTACITIEDAAMMERMQKRGQKIEVHLTMGAQNYPDFPSRNTMVEVEGSEWPDEIVVVSGHLDSWDVGQGAMDDGGGAMISWNAAVVLHQLGLRPRRTIQAVLWTGEEQGGIGGQAYFAKHSANKEKYQMLMESDGGTFSPLGIRFTGNTEATCIMQEIVKLLAPINATQLVSFGGGTDIEEWTNAGVPTGSLHNANDKYFWFHHSAGDTMDVEDPDTLDRCLALWTSVAYVAADITYKIPQATVY